AVAYSPANGAGCYAKKNRSQRASEAKSMKTQGVIRHFWVDEILSCHTVGAATFFSSARISRGVWTRLPRLAAENRSGHFCMIG
ncbi:MAG: hypothetical protein WCS94_09000, partial [Verrucomicrobiota bacterium]